MRCGWWLVPVLGMAGAALADPPPVKRQAVESRALLMFRQADTNHDGFLSRDEYHAAILARAHKYDAKVTPQGMTMADAQFDAIDTGHSGRIPQKVFVGAAMAHFDGADLNHDGTVTPDEARKAARLLEKANKAKRAG
jgi:Ca2+-binding EF-hand superfamily protein